MIMLMTIYRYFISILLVITSISCFSQEKEKDDGPERQIFIRPGIDLSRFALPFIEDYEHTGFEASIDAEIKYKYFPVVEAGWNKVSDKREDYQYESEGVYGRIGMNYNMLKYRHRLDRNLFYIGARFALSNMNQQFTNVIIANEWDNYNVTTPNTSHTAHWVEAVMGLKGEIVKNLYLGYTVRVKILTSKNEFNDIKPYVIPGYGKGYKTTAVGMSYTISYAIPIKNPVIDYGDLKE